MSFDQITEADGSITHVLAGDSTVQFNMQPLDPKHAAVSADVVGQFNATMTTLDTYMALAKESRARVDLSHIGKERLLEPVQAKLIETIATSGGALNAREAQVNAREAELCAVPPMNPAHAAVAVEDREIRDWLRAQDMSTVTRLLIEPGNERLKLAVLRSPIPQSDAVVTLARDAWKEARAQANLNEWVGLTSVRASITWARRGVANVAGLTRGLLSKEWNEARILRSIVTSPNLLTNDGYGAFGFNATDVAFQRQSLAAEQRRRAS